MDAQRITYGMLALGCAGLGYLFAPPPEAVAPAPPTPVITPQPPDLRELRVLLEPYSATLLVPGRGRGQCNGGNASSDDRPTLGQYVAWLVKLGEHGAMFLTHPTHRLAGGCDESSADPSYWFCKIEASWNDGDGPAHYELDVRVRRADRAVDLTQLTCP